MIAPVVEAYAPELVLVSAGFDAHRSDPLANMRLEAPAYALMTRHLVRQAARSAGGRIALLLEGGYDLDALESSLGACLDVLGAEHTNDTAESTWSKMGAPSPAPLFASEIERARKIAAEYWTGCL